MRTKKKMSVTIDADIFDAIAPVSAPRIKNPWRTK